MIEDHHIMGMDVKKGLLFNQPTKPSPIAPSKNAPGAGIVVPMDPLVPNSSARGRELNVSNI